MNPHSIRMLLVDDHAVLRVGLRAFFEEQKDCSFNIVGEAASGEQALDMIDEKRPDIILLDLNLEGMGGLQVIIELRRRNSPCKILVLTQYADAIYLRRCLESGANGYVLKSARGDELLTAILAIMAGGTYVEPSLAASLVKPKDGKSSPLSVNDAFSRLTTREKQVLGLIAEGHSNKEIAKTLDVAVKTAMAHRANLMEKLDIHNRSKLIRFAIQVGLIPGD